MASIKTGRATRWFTMANDDNEGGGKRRFGLYFMVLMLIFWVFVTIYNTAAIKRLLERGQLQVQCK